jgi:hypothetical protein
MLSAYEGLPKEAREEWLDHPVTRAFLATIKSNLDMTDKAVIAHARLGDALNQSIQVYGIQSRTLDWVVKLITGGLTRDVA